MPRFLFWKALLGLMAFDVFLLGRNFLRMHKLVSSWKVTPRSTNTGGIERAISAVNYACVCYPKRVLCLQRSVVTTCLLRDCGVPAQMVMGARNLPFKAHAWTEVNGLAVNEPRNVKRTYDVLERC
jgi:hypothetical protein